MLGSWHGMSGIGQSSSGRLDTENENRVLDSEAIQGVFLILVQAPVFSPDCRSAPKTADT